MNELEKAGDSRVTYLEGVTDERGLFEDDGAFLGGGLAATDLLDDFAKLQV